MQYFQYYLSKTCSHFFVDTQRAVNDKMESRVRQDKCSSDVCQLPYGKSRSLIGDETSQSLARM